MRQVMHIFRERPISIIKWVGNYFFSKFVIVIENFGKLIVFIKKRNHFNKNKFFLHDFKIYNWKNEYCPENSNSYECLFGKLSFFKVKNIVKTEKVNKNMVNHFTKEWSWNYRALKHMIVKNFSLDPSIFRCKWERIYWLWL